VARSTARPEPSSARPLAGAVIRLSPRARAVLGPDEVLVFDWHRVAICCATLGETSLRAMPRARLAGSPGRRFRPMDSDPPDAVVAHERAYQHLAGQDVAVDSRSVLGVRIFTTDLPADFGLRASLGWLPRTVRAIPTQEAIHDDV